MRQRAGAGYTLVELLIVVAISGLIITVLASVFLVATRIWRRASSQAQAFPPAYQLMSRLSKEVKNACYVHAATDASGQDYLTINIPQTVTVYDDDGKPIIYMSSDPPVSAKAITYYLSDGSGVAGRSGKYLWRSEQIGSATPTKRQIAKNVEYFRFDNKPLVNGRIFALYSTTICFLGKEGAGGKVFKSSFKSAIAIQNRTADVDIVELHPPPLP